MRARLTPLQSDLLRAFFERTRVCYLTGGAALAGYHLGHRSTHDLDLFTLEDRLDDAERALADAASSLGGSVERIQTAPDFRRRIVRRGEESVVVDLVRERVEQGPEPKLVIDGVIVDPPSEILANKLCTLLSRSEARDLVDVCLLLRTGLDLERALELGQRKDGGLTPGQLAWLLSQIRIGEDARIPAQLTPAELREFVDQLRERLERLAFPS